MQCYHLLLCILINLGVLWLERYLSTPSPSLQFCVVCNLQLPHLNPTMLSSILRSDCFLSLCIKVGKTFSQPNGRRPDHGSKALGDLNFQVCYFQPCQLNFRTYIHVIWYLKTAPLHAQIGDYLDVAILFQQRNACRFLDLLDMFRILSSISFCLQLLQDDMYIYTVHSFC